MTSSASAIGHLRRPPG